MILLMGVSAIVTMVALLAYLAIAIFRRETDLLSYRSFFIIGFCFFYGLATVFVAFGDTSGYIYQPTGEGFLPLAICTPGFAILFVIADRLGTKFSAAQKLVPKLDIPPTTASLFTAIVVLILIAIIALTPLGDYFTATLGQVRPALAACAAGLATYYLIAQKFNPIAWAIFLSVFVLSLLISVSGGTDRRFSLGIFMVCAWMWYYFDLRYRPLRNTMTKMAVLGAIAAFFLVVYSGFRNVGRDEQAFANRVEQFKNVGQNSALVQNEAVNSVLYQDAPINTLYIMENYPTVQPIDPFNGLLFFITNPIPRAIWENKPIALGIELNNQFGINANLGPGIIGHGWSEGLWLGVAGYAIFFGFFCGIFDRTVRENPFNPFLISVFGSSLGNVIGLPRGETSLFLVLWFSGVVATFAILGTMGLLMNPVYRSLPLVMPERVRDWLSQSTTEESSHEADYGIQEGDSLQDPKIARAYAEEVPRS